MKTKPAEKTNMKTKPVKKTKQAKKIKTSRATNRGLQSRYTQDDNPLVWLLKAAAEESHVEVYI